MKIPSKHAIPTPLCLTTERFCIRPIKTSDIDAIFAIKSDPEVTTKYGQSSYTSLDQSRDFVKERIADLEKHDSVYWVIALKDSDEAIGSCCFWNFENENFLCAELGYEINRKYWRTGVMSEVLPVVMRYGFDDLGLNRIEACPFAINEPSVKLLMKFGFTLEGTLRQRHFYNGTFLDQLYFGLLKEEWSSKMVWTTQPINSLASRFLD